jgi:hypothetical protein
MKSDEYWIVTVTGIYRTLRLHDGIFRYISVEKCRDNVTNVSCLLLTCDEKTSYLLRACNFDSQQNAFDSFKVQNQLID